MYVAATVWGLSRPNGRLVVGTLRECREDTVDEAFNFLAERYAWPPLASGDKDFEEELRRRGYIIRAYKVIIE